MAKFSHTQSTLLTMAAARQDGAATIPTNTRNAAATKAAAGLVERKLMREMRTRKGMPVWREDDAGRRVSLVITRAGRNALGAEDIGKKDKDSDIIASRDSKITRAASRRSSQLVRPAVKADTVFEVDPGAAPAKAEPRSGTKLAQVIGMLMKSEGATLEALVGATGWQSHTVRAALTSLRKRGFSIEREHVDGGGISVYRIVETAERVA